MDISSTGPLPQGQAQSHIVLGEQPAQPQPPRQTYTANATEPTAAVSRSLVQRQVTEVPPLVAQFVSFLERGIPFTLSIHLEESTPDTFIGYSFQVDHPIFKILKDDLGMLLENFSRLTHVREDTTYGRTSQTEECYIQQLGEMVYRLSNSVKKDTDTHLFDFTLKVFNDRTLTESLRARMLLQWVSNRPKRFSDLGFGAFYYDLSERVLSWHFSGELRDLFCIFYAHHIHISPGFFSSVGSLSTLEGRISKIDTLLEELTLHTLLAKEIFFLIFNFSCFCDFTCRNREREQTVAVYESTLRLINENIAEDDQGDLALMQLLYGSYKAHYQGQHFPGNNPLLSSALRFFADGEPNLEDERFFSAYLEKLNKVRERTLTDQEALDYYDSVLSQSTPEEPCLLSRFQYLVDPGPPTYNKGYWSPLTTMLVCIAPSNPDLAKQLRQKLLDWGDREATYLLGEDLD
tara:strand:- start:5124 stop:6509 length:1386 start_codon:yes stop_codon:yes gene_type:complete